MDELDRADKEAQVQLDSAIAHQKHLAKQKHEEYCVECGVLIPLERQEATGGTDHCTPCKEIIDA